MPISDYLGWIHGKDDRSTGSLVTVPFGWGSYPTYTEDQIDFGTIASTAPGGISSLLPNIASGAIRMGLHLIVSQAYAGTLTAPTVSILTSAASANSGTGVVLTSRLFTSAQFATSGLHYFIPLPPGPANILEFLAAKISGIGTASAGAVEAWFGPDADGAI